MASLATTINGRTTKLVLRRPWSGVWSVVADFDSRVDTLAGPATVQIGDATFEGTFVPSLTGSFQLQSKAVIVGGKGGWRQSVPKAHEHSDAGIRAKSLIVKLAQQVGETLGTVDIDAVVGADYVRVTGPAARAMDRICAPLSWWVDAAGATQVGTRPEVEVAGSYEVLDYDPRWKLATVTVDRVDQVAPGSILRNRLDEPVTVREVEATIANGKVRLECFGQAGVLTSRLRRDLQAMVRHLIPELPYLGAVRYRIVKANAGDNRWWLQAVVQGEYPDTLPISVRCFSGIKAEHALGQIVRVMFTEGDPYDPFIVGFAAPDEAGWKPDTLTLDAGEIGFGGVPTEHATSAEALVSLFDAFCTAVNTTIPGPLTGVGLFTNKAIILNAAIALTATVPITPYAAAIAAALAAKLPDVTGQLPSIGWPTVKGS